MYFDNCKTEQETKAAFRHLSKILHPDVGGTHEAFIAVQDEYLKKLRSLHGTYNSKSDEAESKRKYQFDEEIETDLINMIRAIQGLRLPETVEISLQGTWIWVRGTLKNSRGHYPLCADHVRMLEALGLKHHTMKGECYYRDSANRCRNKGKVLHFDRIRARYRGNTWDNSGRDQITN